MCSCMRVFPSADPSTGPRTVLTCAIAHLFPCPAHPTAVAAGRSYRAVALCRVASAAPAVHAAACTSRDAAPQWIACQLSHGARMTRRFRARRGACCDRTRPRAHRRALRARGARRGKEDPTELAPYRAAGEITGGAGDVLVGAVADEVVRVCQLIVFRHLQSKGGLCAEVESVHVHPAWRSQGIGRVLMRPPLPGTRRLLPGAAHLQPCPA